MFYLLLDDMQDRDAVIDYMQAEESGTPFHYIPLHSAPAGQKFARTHGSLSVTDDVSSRLVRLPMHFDLGTDIEVVVAKAHEYLSRASTPS